MQALVFPMLFGIITFNLMNNKNEEMIKILF